MSLRDRLPGSGKAAAFLIHLSISALAVGVVGVAMLILWYPFPYFSFDGGWQVLRIIVLVDVVLGPLLTLIVFRRGKPGIRRDLSVIGAVQVAALLYGAGVMFLYRPAFVVYAENNFFTVANADVERNTRDRARLDALRAPRGPAFVALSLPADPADRERLREQMRRGGPPITWLGDHYQAIDETAWGRIVAGSIPIERLARDDSRIAEDLRQFTGKHPRPLREFVFLPVTGRYGVVMLVFERSSRTPIDWMQ